MNYFFKSFSYLDLPQDYIQKSLCLHITGIGLFLWNFK
ncbi:hypothetical protein KIS4809_2229 [Bacillus sp. ZZV12-4809]|nr:hypothetical protein KIS4809_2229 [Bacillus sp. ZZV12-4809]